MHCVGPCTSPPLCWDAFSAWHTAATEAIMREGDHVVNRPLSIGRPSGLSRHLRAQQNARLTGPAYQPTLRGGLACARLWHANGTRNRAGPAGSSALRPRLACLPPTGAQGTNAQDAQEVRFGITRRSPCRAGSSHHHQDSGYLHHAARSHRCHSRLGSGAREHLEVPLHDGHEWRCRVRPPLRGLHVPGRPAGHDLRARHRPARPDGRYRFAQEVGARHGVVAGRSRGRPGGVLHHGFLYRSCRLGLCLHRPSYRQHVPGLRGRAGNQ